MGSTGSGSFSDYSDYNKSLKSGSGQGGQGDNGGSSGQDQCSRAFSTRLDEVATSEFYRNYMDVPALGSHVHISFDTRLVVLDQNNVCIGFLPTKLNYLRACMIDGFAYSGVIIESSTTPLPTITIDIAPNHE